MISKPKGISAKRWGSGVLVGAVSVLMMGVPFAAPANAAATSVTVTPTSQDQPAGGGNVATYSITAAGATQMSYTVLSDPNGAVTGSNNTNPATGGTEFPAAQKCLSAGVASNTSCDIPSSGTAGTATVRIFDDANQDSLFTSGEPFQDVTVVFSGPPFSISLTPDSATTPINACQKYTITATDSGGRPAAGAQIDITVHPTSASFAGNVIFCTPTGGGSTVTQTQAGTAGADLKGNATTDSGATTSTNTPGQAIFGIQSNTVGTASVTVVSHANAGVSDTSTQTWTANGANAATSLTVSPTSANGYNGSTVTYSVTVKDTNGNPLSTVDVSYGVTSGTDAAAYPLDGSHTCTTNGSGVATCTLTNGGTAGTDNVEFWVNQTTHATNTGGPDSGEPTATATASFTAQPAVSSIVTSCTTPGATSGTHNCTIPTDQTSITFSATVKNAGVAVSGAVVTWTIGGTATSSPASGTSTTDANGVATFTVTTTSPIAGKTVTATAKVGTNPATDTSTATYATRAATTFTLSPKDETVTNGGAVSFTAKVVDQFGTGVSGQSISYSVSGRNAGKTGTVTTGADGTATISYTDAGVNPAATTDTVNATDTTTAGVNAPNPNTQTSTVHYITGSTTASTVAVATNGVTFGTTCPTTTAGSNTKTGASLADGTNATSYPVCAHVTNSTGEVLAGKSVTFTVDIGFVNSASNGAQAPTTDTKTVTVSTDGNGNAYATVYSQTSGKQTVTATADSASGTGSVTYNAPPASAAYAISLAPANPTITPGASQPFTASVVDQFGNPDPGVTVSFSTTGPGTFGAVSSTSGTTDTNGKVTATLTTQSTDTGTGTVTAAITAPSTVTCSSNTTATTNPSNCSATSTYTVKKAATPSGVSVSAPTGRTGHTETARAVVVNSDGTRASGVVVKFAVTGANSASGAGTTNSNGVASFSYTPHHAGLDHIRAVAQGGTNPAGTTTARIKQTMHASISCKSPHKHVLRCVVHVSPAKAHLAVIFKKRTSSGPVRIGSDTTNRHGVAKLVLKHQKSHKLFRVFAHVKSTRTTTGATTGTARVRIS